MHGVLSKLGISSVNPGGFCGEWLGSGETLSPSPIDGQASASVRQVTPTSSNASSRGRRKHF